MRNLFFVSFGVALLFAAAAPVEASVPVYKYELEANDLINSTCRKDNRQKRSRVKLKFYDQEPGAPYRMIKLQADLCTRSYGFRTVEIWVNMPAPLFDQSYLNSFAVGDRELHYGVPSTNRDGVDLNLEIRRQGSVSLQFAARAIRGSAYLVSWPSVPQNNDEYLPLEIRTADPRELEAVVPGFRAGYHNPWAGVTFRYKHKYLSQPLVMRGNLYLAAEER